jgi:hypothetical protein
VLLRKNLKEPHHFGGAAAGAIMRCCSGFNHNGNHCEIFHNATKNILKNGGKRLRHNNKFASSCHI